MRKKKTIGDTSSLDLFLDTICNTFGGIVFLAILLSVLVQMRSKEPEVDRQNSTPVTPDQYREISLTLNNLSSARSRLSSSIAQLQSLQGSPEDSRVQEELQIVDVRKKALEVVLEQQTSVTQQLSKQLEENSTIVEELRTLKEQLIESQAALEQKEAALDEALADNMEVLKLPSVQTTLKANVIFLLRYGKLYPVYQAQSETPFATHVKASLGAGSLSVSARPNAGWELSNLLQRQETVDYLSAYSPSQNFVSIAVWPDSFVSFSELKLLLLDMGLEYQLEPVGHIDEVVIGKSTELPTIQ